MLTGPFGPCMPSHSLSVLRHGPSDPTMHLGATWCTRATLTPAGPGTLHLDWSGGTLDASAWGDGAAWLLSTAEAMVGLRDPGHRFDDAHPAVMRAQRHHPGLRIGRSGTAYHDLLPVVLGQRVTTAEAVTQWRRLVLALGETAPGPHAGLHLPPSPAALLARPTWWYHPLGIEESRARALRTVASHATRIAEWSMLPAGTAAPLLERLPGIGPWTAGHVLGSAWGCPDAVPVGDYHLPHTVVHALTGRARGSDAEMLDLLAPYGGERGRVVRLLQLDGHHAPSFGPRRRIEPTSRR